METANNEENTKALHYYTCMTDIQWLPVDSPHKCHEESIFMSWCTHEILYVRWVHCDNGNISDIDVMQNMSGLYAISKVDRIKCKDIPILGLLSQTTLQSLLLSLKCQIVRVCSCDWHLWNSSFDHLTGDRNVIKPKCQQCFSETRRRRYTDSML